jgi:hypothetical protein
MTKKQKVEDKEETKQGFEFVGEISPASKFGFEYKENFSPSVSLEGMTERFEEKIGKVRKIRKNNILFPRL